MAYGLAKAAGALALIGIAGMAAWLGATNWRPSPEKYPLQGIDLARDPAPVEWGSVRAAGADFAYVVATDGARRRDTAFEANWAALPEAGLRRGAIHLYSLCESGADQANAFNTFVPQADDALPAAIDISYRDDCATRPDRAALVTDLARFIKMVESHLRKPVMLRIARPVESDYELSAAFDRPVWEMANVLKPHYAARPWRMWRATDFRRIAGVDGPINWDVVTQ